MNTSYKKWIILLVALMGSVGIFILYVLYPSGEEHFVVFSPEGFVPESITINVGDTVVFESTRGERFWPASNLHPTHGIYPEFDPQEPISPDATWKFRFNKPGSWKYHDHLEPSFRGVVVVE